MSRSLLSGLFCFALVSLSCAIAPPERAPRAARVAPAPSLAEKHAAPADAVASLAQRLAKRRTGLTGGEIHELARTILSEAKRRQIDPELVLAVIRIESGFDAFAVSPVGAMGLMQILPSTGEELAEQLGIRWRGAQTLFDPIVNVRLGVTYLTQLAARYDSIPIALAAYNWGPGHIDRRLARGTPMPRRYPTLVLEAYGARNDGRRS